MSKFLGAVLLALVALPAHATTYTQLINLVGCRAVPTSAGKDATDVSADWGATGLAYPNYQLLDETLSTMLVCDLRLPPNATQLRSVTLEYLLTNWVTYAGYMELKVFVSEQLMPALALTPKTRYWTHKVASCPATTRPDNVNTLFTCTANANQTLVAYTDYIAIGSRIVPNDRHDLFSAYATVALPAGTTGEGPASQGNAFRLRVSYDAP